MRVHTTIVNTTTGNSKNNWAININKATVHCRLRPRRIGTPCTMDAAPTPTTSTLRNQYDAAAAFSPAHDDAVTSPAATVSTGLHIAYHVQM